MEEDPVVCNWCGGEFSKDEGSVEVELGFLCYGCMSAIMSGGEELLFKS